MTEDIEKPEPIFHARERYYHADEMDAWLEKMKSRTEKAEQVLKNWEFHFGEITSINLNGQDMLQIKEKVKKWDNLYRTDPDATIDIYEEFDEAIEELNNLRDNLEAVRSWLDDISFRFGFGRQSIKLYRDDWRKLKKILGEKE